jgi:NAD(P)-dependent dehydrogenase (short-subunit alcohol dehydrogenase family)
MRLEGKVSIVTGAGLGIGKAVATLFAAEGSSVVAADVNEEAGRQTAEAAGKSAGRSLFVRTDVSRLDDARNLVEAAMNAYGRLDILVNCAGIYSRGNIEETTLQEWNRILSVNLTGVFLCCQAAVPALKASGGGAIINVSSSVGWQYAAGSIVAYAASKFGVTGLSKAIACDCLHSNIRVNCICPGPTDTPMIRASRSARDLQAFVEAQNIGRLARPAEIAAAALFLASDEASFITGAAFPVDGGQSGFR